MDWMIIEPSLESRLAVECTCRAISETTDFDQVRDLCVALTRQNWHQSLLLKQAVTHIGSLESGAFLSD